MHPLLPLGEREVKFSRRFIGRNWNRVRVVQMLKYDGTLYIEGDD